MNFFLDTSSLFKLYYQEVGTTELDEVLQDNMIEKIFLQDISKIEFVSTVYKKIRVKEINQLMGETILKAFKSDIHNYNFILLESLILEQAKVLIKKYGTQGLRTLDSLQLATAVTLRDKADLFITADKLLHSLFLQESLQTL